MSRARGSSRSGEGAPLKADSFASAVPPGTSGTAFPSSSISMSARPVVDVPAQLTDPLISSRYAASVDLNPNQFTTVGDSTSNLQWTVVRTDRPVLLWPIRSTVNTSSGITGAAGRNPTARVDNVAVLNVTIVSGGTGYTTATPLVAVGGTGTAFQSATFTVVAGVVTSITVTTFGNYTQMPSGGLFTFTGGGGGTGLTALVGAQSVQGMTLMDGGLLTAPSTLTATATVTSSTGTGAIVNVNGYAVETVSVTNGGVFSVLPNNPSTVTSGAATIYQTGFTAAGTAQTFNSGSARVIYYAPNRIPATTDYAQRSKGAGIVYLSNPGTWYLQHARDATSEAVTTEYVVIDAQDPAVIARYLAESGCHRVKSSQVTMSASGTNVALLAENRNRTAFLIACADTTLNSARVQLAFGQAATGTNGMVIGTAVSANAYQSGETTWKGSVNGWVLTGTTPMTVYVTEWE